MTLVFTLCSNNYLAQAITLGNSLIRNNPLYNFKIGLVDRKVPQIDYRAIPYDIIDVESIGIESFDQIIERYNITELSTAVKPFFFKYFFSSQDSSDFIIYLDPDIQIYRNFNELESVLRKSEIVILPHFTSPIDDDKFQSEEDFLNSGLYNLGFIAIKNSVTGNRMLNWWADRLRNKAFIDFKRGLFTDQIWINFVPLFFDGVKIFVHPGYNMAYWNLHERQLNNSAEVIKDGKSYPLVFFHFSGFNPVVQDILSKYQNRFSFENRKDILELFSDYSSKLFENGFNEYVQHSCYYVKVKENKDGEIFRKSLSELSFLKRCFVLSTRKLIKLLKINSELYHR